MSNEERKQLLIRFDDLITSKAKGTSKEIAKRLRVSERTFFRLISYMRDEMGVPVFYDRDECRYVYEEEGMLFMGFIPANICSVDIVRKIVRTGGSKK